MQGRQLSHKPSLARPASKGDAEEYSRDWVGNYPLRYLRFRPDCEGLPFKLRLRTGRTPPSAGKLVATGRGVVGETWPAPKKGPKGTGPLTRVSFQTRYFRKSHITIHLCLRACSQNP